MFTGIIYHLGKLKRVEDSTFTFTAPTSFCKQINKGTSVSVNGACLTVLKNSTNNLFSVEIMPETLKRTMLGKLRVEDLVNLELPVSANTLLSGHIVQGHVDEIGKIEEIEREEESRILKISIPKSLGKYIVEKGSIAVNGISLTVISVRSTAFTVGIIPYTLRHTMLKKITVGDKVNIEVDILAKYIEKIITQKYEE